jgi:phosphohistidine phosphatase
MKTLLLMRHAKSSWGDPQMADHDRPLSKRGKRDAPRIGRLIREEGLLPDIILSSTALRARMTTEAIIDQSAYQGKIIYLDELYLAEPVSYLNALRGLPEEYDRALVIGHNPAMETLVELLSGKPRAMPTSALAYFALPIQLWQDINEETKGKIVYLWRPRELP